MTDIELRTSLGEETTERRLLQNFGFFGHYLHVHAGGRNGKQHILVSLYRNGGHMAQSELARQSCVSSAALSEVIAKLEASGHISRVRSVADGRQLDIELTPAGSDKAREIIAAKLAFEEEAFSDLSETERMELLEMLDRVAATWRAIDAREREEAC